MLDAHKIVQSNDEDEDSKLKKRLKLKKLINILDIYKISKFKLIILLYAFLLRYYTVLLLIFN